MSRPMTKMRMRTWMRMRETRKTMRKMGRRTKWTSGTMTMTRTRRVVVAIATSNLNLGLLVQCS